METAISAGSKPKQKTQQDLNSSHVGLYQQLYVPQFNAPNPNMVELEKLYKKYPKISRPLFILDMILLFVLLFNISHKFNSLSWSFENRCGSNVTFLSFGVGSSLIWFVNCFVLAFSLMKKFQITFRIYIFAMGIQLGMIGLSSMFRVFSVFDKNIEKKCQLKGGEIVLYAINTVLELVLISIFMNSAMKLKKVLDNIQILKEKILTPMIFELN